MVVVASLTLAASEALAQGVERRAIGPWTLMSGKGSDGRGYCTVEIRDGGRRAGLQVRVSGERFFGLTNPDWNWQIRRQYPVVIEAGNARWTGPAIAPPPETLGLGIGPTPDPVAALEAGESLDVSAGDTRMSFSLKEFKPAAAALRACLAQGG